jgi:hypothetical protein
MIWGNIFLIDNGWLGEPPQANNRDAWLKSIKRQNKPAIPD